jgi:hypothetical protein
MEKFNKFHTGDVWELTDWSDGTTQSNSGRAYNHIFHRLKKDGKMSGDMEGISQTTLESLLKRGAIKLLADDEPITTGEVDIKLVKQLLQDVGIDTILGIPINKLVVGDGPYIKIKIGTIDSKTASLVIPKIDDVLKKNNIDMGNTNELQHFGGTLSSIYIKKLQG